jgi:hypothetical protein
MRAERSADPGGTSAAIWLQASPHSRRLRRPAGPGSVANRTAAIDAFAACWRRAVLPAGLAMPRTGPAEAAGAFRKRQKRAPRGG